MDDRLKKNPGANREGRNAQNPNRVSPEENFPLTKERRRSRSEFTQQVLPNMPDIPGFHLCWLASNNQYDPLHRRFQMGYMPVDASEMPGYEMYKVKDGENTGKIMCNEMLLCKMPMDIYQDIMAENHHWLPMDESEKIKIQQEQLVEQSRVKGRQLASIEGGIPDESGTPVPDFY